jgi:hypothetical protein
MNEEAMSTVDPISPAKRRRVMNGKVGWYRQAVPPRARAFQNSIERERGFERIAG